MARTLSDDARRHIAVLEAETDARAVDCLVDDDHERVVFVIAAGQIAAAIGPDGRTVRALEDRFGREVALVEDADTPEAFVANALAPAAIYDVTIEGSGDDRVAMVDVDDADRGVAIGEGGRRIELARRLAARHFGIDDVRLS